MFHANTMIKEIEPIYEEIVGSEIISNNVGKTMFTRHNIIMLGGLAAVFITALLPLIQKTAMTKSDWVIAIASAIIVTEHAYAGNTSSTS